MMLRKKIDRDKAHELLQRASLESAATKRALSHVLAETPEIVQHLSPADLRDLEKPEQYLGAAEDFRKSLMASSRSSNRSAKPSVTKSRRKKR